jgi:xanthine dehydrogenase accessory factor
MSAQILLCGGGDLASGVALRLHRAGFKLVITELPEPLTVRRTVAFSEAVYENKITIEGVTAQRTTTDQVHVILERDEIAVVVDPKAEILSSAHFDVVVDARMLKQARVGAPYDVPLHIGLGPGFHAGRNCHAAVETRRSHTLGRVYWDAATQADSGQPEGDARRVLRSPTDGRLISLARIADHLEAGQPVAEVKGEKILAPFSGVLRGIIHSGILVRRDMKVGDLDPRDDPGLCYLVSDKSLAVGGGVLEAMLTQPGMRSTLWRP